jgi:hypothetical protein
VQAALGLDHVAQLSVDAIAHQRAALEGFDVDVGRAFAHRLGEQCVDELDDRGIVFRFEQIGDFGQQFGELLQIDVLADVLDELLGGAILAGVGGGEARGEFGCRQQHELERPARHAPHFGERGGFRIRAQPDFDFAIHFARGDHSFGAREVVGQKAHDARVQAHGCLNSTQIHGLFCSCCSRRGDRRGGG